MRTIKKLGKAQAREQFAPIIESLSVNEGVVEVTDYGKVAAVMMSHKQYLLLLAMANTPINPRISLCGSATLQGDLEVASREISDLVKKSLDKTAEEL